MQTALTRFLPTTLIWTALLALCACAAQTNTPGSLSASNLTPGKIIPLPSRPVPQIEPQLTVIPRPDLWRNVRQTFELDHRVDERRVRQELAWLQRHPNYLPNLQSRFSNYLAYIHQRVVDRGLPGELALLPIVESALDPYAFSPGGAAGLWQFIAATGKRYGLDRNWWYDGRRDPIAATEAALDYLEHLHNRFGDWSLALAGYNAGEGNVSRALRRGAGETNFWKLRLPRETSAYVPRLLALSAVVADPARYGLTLPAVSPEIPFVLLDTNGQLDLSVAAAATGVEVATFYRWNPALNQWSTPPAGPNHLLLPRSIAADAQQQLDDIPAGERVRWLRIKVKSGDTLSTLAQRYRTDITSLRQANNLRGSTIRAGQPLLIPKSEAALSNQVAQRTSGASYTVKSGDSLWTISRAQKVSMNKLMRANHVGPKDVLRVGQRLTLPGRTGNNVTRKVRYGVRKGDSLARIAGKFNVSVSDITGWNKLSRKDYLQPGQSLMLYVNVVGGD